MEPQDHRTGPMPPHRPDYTPEPPTDPADRPQWTEGPPSGPADRPQWTEGPPSGPADRPQWTEGPPSGPADRSQWTEGPPSGPADRPGQPDPAYGSGWTASPPAGGPPPYRYADPVSGEPERPPWSGRRTTVVAAAAAAAVLGIGGVAVAHSGGGSGSGTTQGPGGQFGGPGGFRGGPEGVGLAGALHGTFVTESDGSYVTRVMQTGQVTAVSSGSITVKSVDGYTRSYSLSGSTTVNGGRSQAGAIRTGHTVTVVASESGAATSVTDESLASTGRGQFPGGGPGGAVPGQGSGQGR